MRQVIQNVALLVGSLLLSLALVEGILAIMEFPTEIQSQVAHPPNFSERRNFLEFNYEFRTNSLGLREREVSLRKAKDTRRIMIVGDSYTEGLGVASEQRFTDLLQQRVINAGHKVEIINGGLSGTGPTQYARVFEQIGLKYDLDSVIIFIFANDVANTPEINPSISGMGSAGTLPSGATSIARRLMSLCLPRFYTIARRAKNKLSYLRRVRTADFVGDLTSHATKIGVPTKRVKAWQASLPTDIVAAINQGRFGLGVLSYGLIYPQFWIDSLDLDTERSRAKYSNMEVQLDRIANIGKKNGISVALVYAPVFFQYDPKSHSNENLWIRTGTTVRRSWLEGVSPVEQRLSGWAAKHDLPIFNLTETFRSPENQSSGELNFSLDGHWTAAGHEVAAKALASWLIGKHAPGILQP